MKQNTNTDVRYKNSIQGRIYKCISISPVIKVNN